METKTAVKLILPDFNKCMMYVDADCPLGELYDYSCALVNFVLAQMEAKKPQKEESQPQECAPMDAAE